MDFPEPIVEVAGAETEPGVVMESTVTVEETAEVKAGPVDVKEAEPNADGNTIRLRKPCFFEGERIEEVRLHELTGKDFIAVTRQAQIEKQQTGISSDLAIDFAVLLAARAADRPREFLEALPIGDFMKVVAGYIPLAMQ